MGKMRSLEVLYLGESGLEVKNQLSGKIPEQWSGMKSLERLSLSGNSGIRGKFPSWIGKLDALEELTLANTGLTGELPESIDQCYNLRLLDVSSNKLTGTLPEGLARLSRLRHLRLGGNALVGSVPPDLASLADLETLDLGGNKLEGTLRLRSRAFASSSFWTSPETDSSASSRPCSRASRRCAPRCCTGTVSKAQSRTLSSPSCRC